MRFFHGQVDAPPPDPPPSRGGVLFVELGRCGSCSFGLLSDDQTGVHAAEAEGVRQDGPDTGPARAFAGVVQVAFGIGVSKIDRRGMSP